MKTFIWHGLDQQGNYQNGSLIAVSTESCKHNLLQQNIFPLKIHVKHSFFNSKKIPTKTISDFSRKFSLLINANIPIIAALEIATKDEPHHDFKKILQAIKKDLLSGSNLVAAFSKQPNAFDQLYCGLLNVGDKSGNLDKILQYIATHTENIEKQKRKILKALFYPACVLIVAIIVSIILLIFVVPQFKNIFSGFGAPLPLYTQCIIALAEWIKEKIIFLIVGIICIVLSFKHFHASSVKLRSWCDKAILKLPIAGKLIANGIIFRLIKTLAITFKSGVPLLESLTICAEITGNIWFKNATLQVANSVACGKSLYLAMQEHTIFPQKMLQLILIGEESGQLDTILDKITLIYEEEIQHTVDNLNNLLEPLIMIILGIIVGGLIIGMYLPIFKLGKII